MSEKTRKINKLHPFDDEVEWVGQRFEKAPWTADEIAAFQRKLDSAFGAENAIVLAWSGDKRYWDEFYEDWYANGLPKGALQKKPIVLFGQFDINETEYMYVYPPRWLLLERHHPAQYGDSWEDSSWVEDPVMQGGKKRIRAENPPAALYVVLKVIAEHDGVSAVGHVPKCCNDWYANNRRACYGRYRPPSDIELDLVRSMRRKMDAEGVAQRNDAPMDAKTINRASLMTKHYMEQASLAQAQKIKDFIMEDPYSLVEDIVHNKGITASRKEIADWVEIGINQSQEARLSK